MLSEENVVKDIKDVITKMTEEKIPIDNWALTEIPMKSTYLFFNESENLAFDYEKDVHGLMRPHYYRIEKGKKETKHPTKTILESINNYSI